MAVEETLRILDVTPTSQSTTRRSPSSRGQERARALRRGGRNLRNRGADGQRLALQAGTSLPRDELRARFRHQVSTKQRNSVLPHDERGMSARMVGHRLAHGDDQGLRLPPVLAPSRPSSCPSGARRRARARQEMAERVNGALVAPACARRSTSATDVTPATSSTIGRCGACRSASRSATETAAGCRRLGRRDMPGNEGKQWRARRAIGESVRALLATSSRVFCARRRVPERTRPAASLIRAVKEVLEGKALPARALGRHERGRGPRQGRDQGDHSLFRSMPTRATGSASFLRARGRSGRDFAGRTETAPQPGRNCSPLAMGIVSGTLFRFGWGQ